MVRENNKKDFKSYEEEMPKFGAGSEFGREQREEARRKKFGMKKRVYNPDAQPWLMRIGSKKEGKTYKGVREGGVADNTTYYVFTHAADGCFEAHPVKEWYNFTPRLTYKTFNAEEAEEKFAERGKILNHWAVMVNKKLRPDQDNDDDDEDMDGKKGKKAGSQGKKELKISDMDDWVESGDELDSDSDDDGEKKKKKKDDSDDEGGKKNSRSKDSKKKNKKKSKEDVELEGFEDSDDGDGEGREVDYMSDESSESEEEMMEQANQKGVDQDEGLAKMLDSDDSDSDEDKDKDKEDEDDSDDDKPKKKKRKAGEDDSGDEAGGKGKKNGGKGSKNSSRAATPTPDDKSAASDEKRAGAEKRKAMVDNLLDPNQEPSAKKSRLDSFGSSQSSSSSFPSVGSAEAAFEEDVRRYLARKPMTTTEILRKLKSKKTALHKDDMMKMLVNVLKRINPHKQKVKGTMYLSLKTDQQKR